MIYIATSRNHKFSADSGFDSNAWPIFWPSLVPAGSNFIFRSEFLDEVDLLIQAELLPNTCHAKINAPQRPGIVKLSTRPGTLQAAPQFIDCMTLSALAILGADFCDQNLEAIRLMFWRWVGKWSLTSLPLGRGWHRCLVRYVKVIDENFFTPK